VRPLTHNEIADTVWFATLLGNVSTGQTCGENACHPERSEGSVRPSNQILSAAKDDSEDTAPVGSREVFSPNV
jgi:hypothetical protein